jgi:23S rRNA (cytidine1920-2'-O)/16S rRNA (cytidine1409-2'-O)-methyltransferase
MILAGLVRVKGMPVTKAGVHLPQDAQIEIRDPTCTVFRKGTSEFLIGARRYASRGGQKLEHALSAFAIHPVGWTAMDVGASTGGFTDCLLQQGASKVFAVDVGYGQLSWRLRQDPRVVVIERTNIRYLTKEVLEKADRRRSRETSLEIMEGPPRITGASPKVTEAPSGVTGAPSGVTGVPTGVTIDLITVDLSFISLKLVLPKLLEFLKYDGRIVALVKPQFEVGKGEVGRGGLVKDPAKHQKVLAEVCRAAERLGLTVNGITASPISGRKGNQEYFIYLISRGSPLTSREDLLKGEATE